MLSVPKFAARVEQQFPSIYASEAGKSSEIILINMSEKTYGSISLQALEALGRHCLRSTLDLHAAKVAYWADLYNPSAETLERLEKAFGFHPLTTEDVSVSSTREKSEEYTRYMYFVFSERQFVPNSNNVRLVNVNMLLFRNFILTIHRYPLNSFPTVLHSIVYRPDAASHVVEWVAYRFMDAIVDELMDRVDALSSDVRQIGSFLTQMVGSNSQEDFILRIAVSREQIAELTIQLIYKRDVLVQLSAEKQILLQPQTKLYLRDTLDHVVLMLQQLQHSEDVLNNANATYLALISIKMAEGADQVNLVMKRFSAMATLVIPLTLVAGLMGMNVEVPGETWGLGLLWFFLILLAMCIWTCCAMLYFKWRRWI